MQQPNAIPQASAAVNHSAIETSLAVSLAAAGSFADVQRAISRSGLAQLGLSQVSVVPFSMQPGKEATPELLCDAVTEMLLRNLEVRRQLSEGKIVAINASEGAIVRNAVLVPGIVRGEIACVISANHGNNAHEFTPAELHVLEALAGQAALALNAMAWRRSYEQAAFALSTAERKLRENARRPASEFPAIVPKARARAAVA